MPIRFHNADIRFSLKHKRKLKQFLHHQINVSSNYHIVSLDFIFCSDEYLLDINRRFLKHDDYTDIITFDLSENEQSLISEIYISVERVRENAEKFRRQKHNTRQNISDKRHQTKTFEFELYRVMFHGALHLLGYKDKSKKDKEEMRQMEDKWLKEFSL